MVAVTESAGDCGLHDRPRVLRHFEINSSNPLTAASAPDYHTKQFKISKATLTSRGEYIWNGTKVKRW